MLIILTRKYFKKNNKINSTIVLSLLNKKIYRKLTSSRASPVKGLNAYHKLLVVLNNCFYLNYDNNNNNLNFSYLTLNI